MFMTLTAPRGVDLRSQSQSERPRRESSIVAINGADVALTLYHQAQTLQAQK
jgi:hypothetical protein